METLEQDSDIIIIEKNENEELISLDYNEKIVGKIYFDCIVKNTKEFKEIKNNIYNLFSNFSNFTIKDIRKMNKTTLKCVHILTRGDNTGKCCGKNCIDDTEYCKIHLKVKDKKFVQTKKEEEKINDTDNNLLDNNIEKLDRIEAKKVDNAIVIYKNEYNNFVYGKTKLILKSPKEKFIVAKEGENGSWLALTDEDIELCKQYRLKYKIIDPNEHIVILDTKEYTRNLFKI